MGAILGMSGGGGTTAIASWLVITFVGVLWHELGHALVARAFGLSARIELSTMGGLTHHDAPATSHWHVELLIAIAGPGMGLALGGIVWLGARNIGSTDPFVVEMVHRILWVNVGWSLVNLLPILPYDGGLALRAILASFTASAAVIAEVVTIVVAVGGAAIALLYRSYWAAYLAILACTHSVAALSVRRRAQRMTRAWEHFYDGRADEAVASVSRLLAPSDRDNERAEALELTAWAALLNGDLLTVRSRVQQMPRALEPSGLLRATLALLDEAPASLDGVDAALLRALWPRLVTSWVAAGQVALLDRLLTRSTLDELSLEVRQLIDASLFHAGDHVRAADVAVASFAAHGHPIDAYNAACCFARMQNLERGLEWIDTTITAGFHDVEGARHDDDLALLRHDPRFVASLARVAPS